MVPVSPARLAAFRLLVTVEGGRVHADELLRTRAVDALSAADRHLATTLSLGVLRWQISLDARLRPLLKRPGAKLETEVLVALRLGAFQLEQLSRIPARAAIAESVELTKQAGHHFAAGMVNAVLRRFSATVSGTASDPAATPTSSLLPAAPRPKPNGAAPLAAGSHPVLPKLELHPHPKLTLDELAISATTTAELALNLAHPLWLVERWVARYGLAAARSICLHGQRQPQLALRLPLNPLANDVTIEPGKTNPSPATPDSASQPVTEPEKPQSPVPAAGQPADPALAGLDLTTLDLAGLELAPGELLLSARRLLRGDAARTTAVRTGSVRLQDEGSQLVAELVGFDSPVGSNSARASQIPTKILDTCAAPGGKTLILAERYPQARITACELDPKRHDALSRRLNPLGDRVDCRQIDATTLAPTADFDLILVDAPCSGTGTLGRNPEIRHRLDAEALARQAARQRAILSAALGALRPGGRLFYSTCSLEAEENEEVVGSVLGSIPGLVLVPLGGRIECLATEGILAPGAAERLAAAITPEGFLRLIPGLVPTDGFFVAALERLS